MKEWHPHKKNAQNHTCRQIFLAVLQLNVHSSVRKSASNLTLSFNGPQTNVDTLCIASSNNIFYDLDTKFRWNDKLSVQQPIFFSFFFPLLFTIPPSLRRLTRYFVLTWNATLSICCSVAQRFSLLYSDSSLMRFRSYTQRRTTVGRTFLDEVPARHRDLYLTTHTTLTTHKRPSPGGIRTHNPSRRTTVDSLRPRGHWDRHRRQWKESLKRQKLFQNGKQEKGTKQTAMEESNVSKAMSIKLIWCEKIIIIATMQCMYSAKESNLMICMRRMEQGFMCDN